MSRLAPLFFFLVSVLLLAPLPARAFVLAEDELEEKSTELGLMLRAFSFALTGPTLRPPYSPEDGDPTALGLFDLRLSFVHRRPHLKLVVHNQLSGQIRSVSGAGLLPLGRGLEPPRWWPLQADLVDHRGFTLRESLDWLYLETSWGPLTVALGRQPVTFGRGKLWRPEDLVSTFSLTEVDTEFKPGSDALRLDLSLGARTTLTAVAAAGKWGDDLSLSGSAFVLRAKQGWSTGEAGLLAGYVRGDGVIGLDGVLDLGPLDTYAEVTVSFPTARSLSPRPPATARAVTRGTLGATLKPLPRLTVSPEIHYNGFGAWRAAEQLGVALSERVGVGELASLGQLYLGTVALWEVHPLLQLTGSVIVSPADPSGLLFLGLTYSMAQNLDLLAGWYLPAGRLPDRRGPAPVPRSEFGLYPQFVFLELRAAH